MKRIRGRNHRPGGGGGGGGGSPIRHHNGQIPLNRNHVFDSNGPDLRVRGTAQQIFEKYLQLGRDATSSGDRVMAEGYFQFAEHYFRILNAIAQAAQQNQGIQQNAHPNNQQRGRSVDEQDGEDRGGEDPLISGNAPPPQFQPQPAYQAAERYQNDRQNDERPAAEFQERPVAQERAPERAAQERAAQERVAQERAAPERPPAEARPPRERAPRQPRERRVVEPQEAAAPDAPRPASEFNGA